MNKKRWFFIVAALLIFGFVFFLKAGNSGTAFLWNLSDQGTWLLPLVGIAALIDSINPCAFSVLILTVAFLLTLGKKRSSILAIGGAYIVGIFIVYLLIGFGILRVLHLFSTPHFMAKVGASLLIVLGCINLIREIFPSFPLKFRLPSVSHSAIARLMEKATLPTALLLGALVGLCEFPCTGGPYLMVLGLLSDQKTYLAGTGYLLLYNLLFILPLVIILFLASDSLLLEKVRAWKKSENKALRLGGGIAMIVLGMLILIL
ncbi:hypothetical protein HZA43_03830 [Candidatus Peregrinibacteria bacterium]|nr:hypothetical protein [Candidatus Peregrinibacteria bacterium]